MTIDLWFSATPQSGTGWFLDPAFAKSPNGFLHGSFLASKTTVKFGGQNIEVLVSQAREGWNDRDIIDKAINLRNTNNNWHVWNVYERRLLLDLMAAEYATLVPADISTIWGRGNTNSTSMSWRGFFGLFNITAYHWQNSQERLVGTLIEGFTWTGNNANMDVATLITGIDIATPQLNNSISFPAALPSVGQVNSPSAMVPTDIMRGYSPLLGFDVALLGIVKALIANPTGTIKSPYGMSGATTVAAKNKATSSSPWMCFCINPNDMGLFGLAPSFGRSSGGFVDNWNSNCLMARVSKWLN